MKPLGRALTHNWPLKLTSLGLGVLLWLVILMRTNPWTVREFDAEVEGWPVPEGLQVLSIEPQKVRISLAGRRDRVNRVDPNHLRVRASLSNKEPGDHNILVEISTGTLPRGVEVADPSTYSVHVTLDRTVQQKRAVRIVQRGLPASGFQPVSRRASANEATVTGPQTVVSGVATVVAEVDISTFQKTDERRCLLEARDARNMPVAGVEIDPPWADVEIVVERVNTRTLPVRLGEVDLPPGRTLESIEVSPQVATLTGTPDALAALEYVQTEPVGFTNGMTEARTKLDLPEGLKAVGDDSVRVRVQLGGRATPTAARRPARPTPQPERAVPETATSPDEAEPAIPEPDGRPPSEPETDEPGDEDEPGAPSPRPKPSDGDDKPKPDPD
jgi:YbbR domain-containing protein